MGAYKNQDFDFVFRTQQLLKQYEIIKNGNNKAHSRFEVKSQYEKISSIIFRDENSAGNPTFELELSIENVLKFALKISDCFLEAMSNAEGSTNFHYYKEQENDFKFQEIRRMEIR